MPVKRRLYKHPKTGVEMSAQKWSEELGIHESTFKYRADKSIERHGEVVESVFSEFDQRRFEKTKTSFTAEGGETKITRKMKYKGVTRPLDVDTVRVYKRTPRREIAILNIKDEPKNIEYPREKKLRKWYA